VRESTPAALASLQAEVALLAKLIDDLYELSLADIGALVYRKERVAIVPLVLRTLDGYRERLAARRIEVQARFAAGDSPVVDADPARLTQLVSNLLENALCYTDPDGVLRIGVMRDAQRVRIEVEDSAPGVPAESLPRLFERLYRVDASRSRAGGGAGLGLALCKSIVEAHGGEIEARPSSLGGLMIAIALPAARDGTR
jgi:two-component system sensor histidine kinase BaeS